MQNDKPAASIICAADLDDAIGVSSTNGLPWRLPDDLRFFRDTVRGRPVICGKRTYESMLGHRMPGTPTIVTSSSISEPLAAGCELARSLDDAISSHPGSFLIGGEHIFREALDRGLVGTIFLTRVFVRSGGDVFFPGVPPGFVLKESRPGLFDEKHRLRHEFQTWVLSGEHI